MTTKRKKRVYIPEEEDQGSEVNTVYGDLITFIMVFFIMLFVLAYNEKQDDTFFVKMRLKFGAKVVEQQEALTTENLLVSEIQGYIKEEELEEEAQILVDEQKIKILLFPAILFKSGDAKLTQKGEELLRGLGDKLKDVKNPIIVEGHTDNVPINTPKFESNWELSFHRAYSVVKFFIKEYRFSPEQLSGLGYGEYQPIVPNDTAENRAKNRRIEINIIRVSRADANAKEPI